MKNTILKNLIGKAIILSVALMAIGTMTPTFASDGGPLIYDVRQQVQLIRGDCVTSNVNSAKAVAVVKFIDDNFKDKTVEGKWTAKNWSSIDKSKIGVSGAGTGTLHGLLNDLWKFTEASNAKSKTKANWDQISYKMRLLDDAVKGQ